MAAFLLACAVWGNGSRLLLCAAVGGFLMMLVGLSDDIFGVNAPLKLFFQAAIATATVLGSGVATGFYAVGAVLWVVTLTNAHNFVDGMDGLLSGTAMIESGGLFLIFRITFTNQAYLYAFFFFVKL